MDIARHRSAWIAIKVVAVVVTPFAAHALISLLPFEIEPLLGTYLLAVILYGLFFGPVAALAALWTGECLPLAFMALHSGAIGGAVLLVAAGVGVPAAIWRSMR